MPDLTDTTPTPTPTPTPTVIPATGQPGQQSIPLACVLPDDDALDLLIDRKSILAALSILAGAVQEVTIWGMSGGDRAGESGTILVTGGRPLGGATASQREAFTVKIPIAGRVTAPGRVRVAISDLLALLRKLTSYTFVQLRVAPGSSQNGKTIPRRFYLTAGQTEAWIGLSIVPPGAPTTESLDGGETTVLTHVGTFGAPRMEYVIGQLIPFMAKVDYAGGVMNGIALIGPRAAATDGSKLCYLALEENAAVPLVIGGETAGLLHGILLAHRKARTVEVFYGTGGANSTTRANGFAIFRLDSGAEIQAALPIPFSAYPRFAGVIPTTVPAWSVTTDMQQLRDAVSRGAVIGDLIRIYFQEGAPRPGVRAGDVAGQIHVEVASGGDSLHETIDAALTFGTMRPDEARPVLTYTASHLLTVIGGIRGKRIDFWPGGSPTGVEVKNGGAILMPVRDAKPAPK